MKASINLEKFKENIAIAFPNLRTQRSVCLKKQQSLKQSNQDRIQRPQQVSLFDLIETANSPTKEEFAEIIKPDEITIGKTFDENTSDFNNKLKVALKYNPKNKD